MKILSKYTIFFVVMLQSLSLFSVPIHDEDELIVTIKKLHEKFRYYDDVKEYINEHCHELKNKEVIRSLIKNQKLRVAEKVHVLPSLVGWGSFFVGALIAVDACNDSQITEEVWSKKMKVSMGLLILFQYMFWMYDFPRLSKIIKMQELLESF